MPPASGWSLAKDEKAGVALFPKAAVRKRALQSAAVGLALTTMAVLHAQAADPQRGAELYRTHCAACHGSGGKPVLPGAPDFSRPMALLKPDTVLLASIRQGRGAMPGYAGQLRDRDILDLVSHLRTFR
jgi:cytochrome c6